MGEDIESKILDVKAKMKESKTLVGIFPNLSESDVKKVKDYFSDEKSYKLFEEYNANTSLYNLDVHQVNKFTMGNK